MSERILFISNTQYPTRLDFPVAPNKKIETDILSSLIGYKGFKCQLMYVISKTGEVPCDEKYVHRFSFERYEEKARQTTEIRKIVENNKPDVVICMDPYIALHCDKFHASKFLFLMTYLPISNYRFTDLEKFKPETPYEIISTSLELSAVLHDNKIEVSKTFLPLVSYNDYKFSELQDTVKSRVNDIMWYDDASEGFEYTLEKYKNSIEDGNVKQLVVYMNNSSLDYGKCSDIVKKLGMEDYVAFKMYKTFAEFYAELKTSRYCICCDTIDFNLIPFIANTLAVPVIYQPCDFPGFKDPETQGTESYYIPKSGNATYKSSDEKLPIKELNEYYKDNAEVELPIIYSMSNDSHSEVDFNLTWYSIVMSLSNQSYIEMYRYSIEELKALSEKSGDKNEK